MPKTSFKELFQKADFEKFAVAVLENRKEGLAGEKADLVRFLESHELSPEESEQAVEQLRLKGYLRDSEEFSPALLELMGQMKSEYGGLLGRSHSGPHFEAVEEVASQMNLDEDVAEEVLQDLEAGNIADSSILPEHQREHYRSEIQKLNK